MLVALFVPDILTFYDFVTGFAASFVSLLMPAMLLAKASKRSWKNLWKKGVLVGAYVVSMSSCGYSLIKMLT